MEGCSRRRCRAEPLHSPAWARTTKGAVRAGRCLKAEMDRLRAREGVRRAVAESAMERGCERVPARFPKKGASCRRMVGRAIKAVL